MIRHYSDHAANERTFLAWLRTGLSITAFGLVVQKLNFLLALAAVSAEPRQGAARGIVTRVVTPIGHYDGLALSIIGIAIILLGAVRFLRNAREIEAPELRSVAGTRVELALSGTLAALAAGFCLYLVMQK